MRVAVGSTNRAKVEGVRKAFSHYFKHFEVVPVAVESGVHVMPFNEDVVKGAEARALKALEKTGANYGVGLEGGVVSLFGKEYVCGYVAVSNGMKTHGAFGYLWEAPPRVLEQMRKGKELGFIIDELSGKKNTKEGEGASGFFTKGVISREESFEKTTVKALVPFVSKEHY